MDFVEKSSDQEFTAKAAIIKAAGSKLMTEFLDINHTIKFMDTYTAYLYFLILLEEICKGQHRTQGKI